MKTIDRFELSRDGGGRIDKGWRVERYSIGRTVIQHLRTGRCTTGADDGFGNLIYVPIEAPWFDPAETHNGYMQ